MKKLIFIILLFLGCQVNGQSPKTITGLYKACMSNNEGIFFHNLRNAETGDYSTADPEVGYLTTNNIAGILKELYRVGIIFDVTSVPYGSVIDSVLLKLNVTVGDDIGMVVYEAYTLKCEEDYLADFSSIVGVVNGTSIPNFQVLDSKESVTTGDQTFHFVGLRQSLWYGTNYVCYGLGAYYYDYLDSTPSIGTHSITVNLFTETNRPELKVYYHSVVSTPKPIKLFWIL